MKRKTQMMKIGSPELFYLFRKALGLFLLFALSFSDAQINWIGNAVVIDHSRNLEKHPSPILPFLWNSEMLIKEFSCLGSLPLLPFREQWTEPSSMTPLIRK